MHEIERQYINKRLETRIRPTFIAQGTYKMAIKESLAVINGTFGSLGLDKMSKREFMDIMGAITDLGYNYEYGKAANRAAYTNGLKTAKDIVMKAYTTPLSDLKKELGE